MVLRVGTARDRTGKPRTSPVPTIRDPRDGCLGCRPSLSTRPTGATRTSTRCQTKIAHTRPSHPQLQAATPIMRAIRPILRVAIIVPLNGSLRRSDPTNPRTITASASAKANHTRTQASQSVVQTAAPVVGIRCLLRLRLGTRCNSSSSTNSTHHRRSRVRTLRLYLGARRRPNRNRRSARAGCHAVSARTARVRDARQSNSGNGISFRQHYTSRRCV